MPGAVAALARALKKVEILNFCHVFIAYVPAVRLGYMKRRGGECEVRHKMAAAAGAPAAAAPLRAEAPALDTSRPVDSDASMAVEAPASGTGASSSGSAAVEPELVMQWQAQAALQRQAAVEQARAANACARVPPWGFST